LFPPSDMAVSRSPQGTYLVVVAGDVLWFDLASLLHQDRIPLQAYTRKDKHMPVWVTDRKVYVNTRSTQTVKVCTAQNQRGQYERLHLGPGLHRTAAPPACGLPPPGPP